MKTPPCVQNSADYLHTLVEALKLAYADRDSYYGDPRFVPPPLEPLTRTYAARRVKLIDPAAASPDFRPGEMALRMNPQTAVEAPPLTECATLTPGNLLVMNNRLRQLVSSGSPYEPRIGLSRAVRSGQIVAVSGTAPLGPDDSTVGRGDPAAQARRCLEIIRDALSKLGAGLSDVVRTRILLTQIENWESVARVHGEFFKDIRPASTVMQVSRFIDPDWLVEIEADAVIEE